MRLTASLAFGATLLLPGSIEVAYAQSAAERQKIELQFRAWQVRDLWPEAKRRGIRRTTFDRAFQGVNLLWKLPDLHPPGSKTKVPKARWESEFRAPGRYFREARINRLVSLGRAELNRWGGTLDRIEKKYGVSKRIIVAIWAQETGYGRAKLPYNAVAALATQAFMGRKKKFFRTELLAGLRILQEGHIGYSRFRSSWAGALGNPQFLPSKFLEYAVDFDGDGRRDIWDSVPDSLASIGHFLKSHGWHANRDWGFESVVPASVSCALEGPDKGYPIQRWVDSGVRRVSGRPFPASERKRTGFLMMPAGRYGPAFIATKNFYTLKEYNESDVYALFIGHLADRFASNKPLVGRWKALDGFTRLEVHRMQNRMIRKGYDVGGADGLVGFKTRRSIGAWQEKAGRAATCFPDKELVRAIR